MFNELMGNNDVLPGSRETANEQFRAEDNDRTRAARALREDIAQRLADLAIELGDIKTRVAATPIDAQTRLSAAVREVIGLAESVHALSRALDPSIVLHLGLNEALRRETTMFGDQEGIPVRYDGDPELRDLNGAIALTLFRTAQEALRRITHHGASTYVEVQLTTEGGNLRLRIHSDTAEEDPAARAEFDVAAMAGSIDRIGGTLTVTEEKEGKTIEVIAPVETHPAR